MEYEKPNSSNMEGANDLPLLSVNNVDQLVYVNNGGEIGFPNLRENQAWVIFRILSADPKKGVSRTVLQAYLKRSNTDTSLETIIEQLNQTLTPKDSDKMLIIGEQHNEQITGYRLNARVVVVKI